MTRTLLLITLALFLARCEEPIDLNFDSNPPRYLVVDGRLTTEPGAHEVIISRATPFVNGDIAPVTNESVNNLRIIDDLGNTTWLTEMETGVYRTQDDFAAVEGREYELRFTTLDGKEYASKPQKVYAKGVLQGIRANYSVRQVYNSKVDQFVDQGIIEFKADYSFSPENAYLAFDYTGTFILSDLSNAICYATDNARGIAALRTSSGFTDKTVENDNLFWINYDYRFRYTYSLNLKMYTIDRTAYRFLRDAQQQLQTTGSIFDPAPRQIIGNLYNTDDESETVLGFFGVYNVVEERVFVDSNEIPAPRPFDICSRIEGPGLPPDFCFNCEVFYLSTKTKPPFWP